MWTFIDQCVKIISCVMAVDLLLFGAVIKSVSQTQTNKTIKSTVTVVFLKRLCFSAEHRTRQRNAPKIYMTKLKDAPCMINLTLRGARRWGGKNAGDRNQAVWGLSYINCCLFWKSVCLLDNNEGKKGSLGRFNFSKTFWAGFCNSIATSISWGTADFFCTATKSLYA